MDLRHDGQRFLIAEFFLRSAEQTVVIPKPIHGNAR